MTDLLEQLALFTDVDLETEPMVTILVSTRPQRRVPRATFRFPTGQHDRERWDTVDPENAKHYLVRLVDHGPYMLSLHCCQAGVHTDCRNGNHKGCPFQPGRTHEHGSSTGGDFLERRDEHGWWRPVQDEAGRLVPLLPVHVWRCACDCHTDLLSEIDQ